MDRSTYITRHHARFGIDGSAAGRLIKDVTGRSSTSIRRIIEGDEYEVHRVVLSDGIIAYLRIAWPGVSPLKVAREAWAMDQARSAGVPVPHTIAVRSIETSDGDRAAMVVTESRGRQLGSFCRSLSTADRAQVMTEIGRTLRTLHTIAMPGAGLPDDHGHWERPDAKRRSYVSAVLDDSRHLAAAGFSSSEIERVRQIVGSEIVGVEDPPVLCHGDLAEDHLFLDQDLHIVGLIDWGQWYAGSAASELSGITMRYPRVDAEAIIAGAGFQLDKEFRRQLGWHTITQATGEIRWLVTSGQHEELDRPRTALRRALRLISGETL